MNPNRITDAVNARAASPLAPLSLPEQGQDNGRKLRSVLIDPQVLERCRLIEGMHR